MPPSFFIYNKGDYIMYTMYNLLEVVERMNSTQTNAKK